MQRPGQLLRLTVLLVTFTSALWSSRAWACEKMCVEPIRLFRQDQVPGNLVRFKVLIDDPGPLALTTTSGEIIPASIHTMGADRVFEPEAPIAADTDVLLTYRPRCQRSKVATFRFHVTEPANYPLKPAALVTMARGSLFPEEPNRTSAFVDLQHLGPDGTGYASHLIDSVATIDGMPADLKGLEGAQFVRVESYCGVGRESQLSVDSCGTVGEVLPGKHVIEVKTTIVGESIQPQPARAEVELRCSREGSAKVEEKALPPQAARSTWHCSASASRASWDHAAFWTCCASAALLRARRRKAQGTHMQDRQRGQRT